MVAVEGPTSRIHALVAFPRLRDHHQNGVREAAATEVQQLEYLVESCGIAGSVGDHGEDLPQRLGATEDVGLDERLAGTHPVLVAGSGVDFTVVGDAPERVRQRPRREGVGGEPGVHETQRTHDTLVLQVEVEPLELRSRQHALVDEGL